MNDCKIVWKTITAETGLMVMGSVFDVERIRAQFPALNRTYKGQRVVYFDGPGGSQVVGACIDAMTEYMTRGGANLHGAFPSSVETESIIADARASAAALLGAQPDEIAFGPNMTTLNFAIARALSQTWQPGDEIVVSELDHRANVDPWILAARDKGAVVRWLTVDTDSLTLNLGELDSVITERTKVVALGRSSNAVGTVTDVRVVAQRAHQVGAVVVVDAVHAAPHMPLNLDDLDADILLCSAYKFFGPHIGIAAIRRQIFEQLEPYRLHPAPGYIPDKLETGTQSHEGIAGVHAAIGFMSALGTGASLADKLLDGMRTLEAYEEQLAAKLRQGVRALPGVTLYEAPEAQPKTPTIAFRLSHLSPRAVTEVMAEKYSIFIADGDFYATTLADKLGINTSGGWIRAGLAPYNTEYEVDAFLEALTRIVPK